MVLVQHLKWTCFRPEYLRQTKSNTAATKHLFLLGFYNPQLSVYEAEVYQDPWTIKLPVALTPKLLSLIHKNMASSGLLHTITITNNVVDFLPANPNTQKRSLAPSWYLLLAKSSFPWTTHSHYTHEAAQCLVPPYSCLQAAESPTLNGGVVLRI